MDGQDGNQDEVVIEMDDLDDEPFRTAAVHQYWREGTRQHRIAPDNPAGILDGPQTRRYVVRAPREKKRDKSRPRRHPDEETSFGEITGEEARPRGTPDVEAGEYEQFTEAQRRWFRHRETRGVEDRRAPMSTEQKWFFYFMAVVVILALVVFLVVRLSGGKSDDDDGNAGNLTITMAIDDFRQLINDSL